MHAARKAVVAIIAGLATATSLVGAAGSASAEVTAPAKPVTTGSTIKSVKAPQVKQVTQSKNAEVNGQGRDVTAASTPCYAYTSGRGDLCSFYLPNYGQSRGGFFYASRDMRYNYFRTAGWGQNSWLSNKAESAYNYDRYYPYRVFTGAGYTGYYGSLYPRTGVNYNQTYKNDVESAYQY